MLPPPPPRPRQSLSVLVLALTALLVGCSDAAEEPAEIASPTAAAPTRPVGPEDDATEEGDRAAPPPATSQYFPQGSFVDPGTPPANTPAPGPYAHLDPAHLVPKSLLARAVLFFDANKAQIKNLKFITVVDFTPHSGKKRFFVVDMKTGVVRAQVVAHGKMSDPNWTGYATTFGNVSGSNMSSLGFALTGDTYYGTHGRSLRLHGLSPTNSNMYSRAIVIHSATYVVEGQSKQGRSLGCFVLDEDVKDDIVDLIEGGSLLYADLG